MFNSFIIFRRRVVKASGFSNWDPDETRDRLDFEVTEIRITPHAAWALIDAEGQIEALFLEKVENTWIISFHSILLTSSYKVEDVAEDTGEEIADPDAE